jgi:hypothetical protein
MDTNGAGGERRNTMVTVDIPADLHDEDETGYVWTFLDEARQPSLIRPGSIVLAGDDDAPAVAEVVDLIPKETGTIVYLRILPGLFDDYEALVRRSAGLDDRTRVRRERNRPRGRRG